jgi:hypothetical protein
MAVALEAAKNWRLVVVGFNYFSLIVGTEYDDLPDAILSKSYRFSKEWRQLCQ